MTTTSCCWVFIHVLVASTSEFAKGGAVSLLMPGVFTWWRSSSTTGVEEDRERVVCHVLDLRHGIDVLLAQPGVEAGRLGFVGHDFGAI